MVFTHRKKFIDEITIRRNQGEPLDKKYEHILLGTNARMTELQAGIGLVQLKKLKMFLKERKRVAKFYDELFNESKLDVKLPKTTDKNNTNAYFFYPILLNNRDKVAKTLRTKYGIDTRIAYPMPIYKQQLYKTGKAKCRFFKCSVAEEVTKKILNLPIYPTMSESSIRYVVQSIKHEISKT